MKTILQLLMKWFHECRNSNVPANCENCTDYKVCVKVMGFIVLLENYD